MSGPLPPAFSQGGHGLVPVPRLRFQDLTGGAWCELVVPPGGAVYPDPGQAKVGVAHPGCDTLADLAVELDAFYCAACRWNGRVSGAWVMQVIRAGRR